MKLTGYDYSDIYKVLQPTLKQLKKSMDKGYGDYTDTPFVPKSIKLCIRILKRLNSKSYEKVFKKHTKEMERGMELPKMTELGRTTNPKWQAYCQYCMMLDRIEAKDARNLFLIMGKYHMYWWD